MYPQYKRIKLNLKKRRPEKSLKEESHTNQETQMLITLNWSLCVIYMLKYCSQQIRTTAICETHKKKVTKETQQNRKSKNIWPIFSYV
jgi:hypothetical protein